jgi:4-hydroxy-tetrahydrodipicolinate reductase
VSEAPRIRVVLFGLGVIGGGVLRLAERRPGLDVVGVVIHRAENDGRHVKDLVPGAVSPLRASTDGAHVLRDARPDVAVIATRSTLPEVLPLLRLCAASGVRSICTAEDLAYITPTDGPEAREIFALADEHRAAIVALGLNPGFVLDVWPLLLASLAHDVTSIDAERVVDLSGFGPRVRESLGVGYAPDAFERQLAKGAISGHRGFPESLRLIGRTIGRPVDETHVETKPMFAMRDRPLLGGALEAGQTAGVRQIATGTSAGVEWLRLTMTASVALDEAGVDPVDRVHIDGTYPLRASISPGVGAVPGTVGRIVNAIPRVATIGPGVHTALGLGITPVYAARGEAIS